MTPPYGRKRRTKEPLDESERGRWKSWLKTHHSKNQDHGIQSDHFMANRWGNRDFVFWGSKITADGDYSHEIKRCLLLGRKAMTNLNSILKSRDITLLTKVHLVKAMVFPVVMSGCESWTMKKAECQRIDVFELWCWRRLLSPLDCKEIQPVNPKGNQSWIFIGRTDAEAPILWPPDAKNWLIGKDPDAGKDWRQEEKGMTEDEMIGWHHRLDGHEFEQSLGVGDGQRSLACCSPWGCKELDTTEWLNWTCWVRRASWATDLKRRLLQSTGRVLLRLVALFTSFEGQWHSGAVSFVPGPEMWLGLTWKLLCVVGLPTLPWLPDLSCSEQATRCRGPASAGSRGYPQER